MGKSVGGFLYFGGNHDQTAEASGQDVEDLKKIIRSLKGKKYRLSCGHHITFGHFLGSDIIIRNGSNPTIICTLCGY